MPVTISQIADELGFSPATVSLAIRNKKAGKKSLSAETVNIIQKRAAELGYRPNTLAQNLTSNTSTSVGVLLSSLSFGSESLLDGLKMSFSEGYTSFLSVYNGDISREREELDMLLGHRICGLIAALSGDCKNLDLYRYIASKHNMPMVVIERSIEGLDVPVVMADHFNSTYFATKALQNLGHERIMYAAVSFSVDSKMITLHTQGYTQAMEEAGIRKYASTNARKGVKDWYKGGNLRKQVSDILEVWMSEPKRPTALLVDNDWLAYEVLGECFERGIKIPDQLSLMGLGDYVFSSFPYVGLSTVAAEGDYPMQTLIGREAARLLTDIIDGKDWNGKDVVLPVKVVLRATTKKI
jgi:DNA-binding LacI/PurR family transcriptional regulator